MNTPLATSYVVDTLEDIPLHLRDRQPFIRTAEMIMRRPVEEVIGDDGRVLMAGAIELQSTITPGVLTDVCDPDELYRSSMRDSLFRVVYDPEIQRGVKEGKGGGLKEFLRPSEIESMMNDIMENQFECPQLTWNLRAGETVWVYVRSNRELRIYQGVATRPDTNHRHHAIIRTHRQYRAWVEKTRSTVMGIYNTDRTYGLVIYTDDFKGEAHRFYVFNFLGWRVPTSTAHYIESKTREPHIHSRLARELMDRSSMLGAQNVEILSNHLSRNSAKMITFGTMVDALKGSFSNLVEDNYAETVEFLLQYLDTLSVIRSGELAVLSVAQRQKVRNASVVDQAVLWHGYIRLAAWLRENHPTDWKDCLTGLNKQVRHVADGKVVSLDVFSRDNPRWAEVGIIAPGKKGPRVVNNRQARQGAFEVLRELVAEATPQLVSA
jgi:hypothetical protein